MIRTPDPASWEAQAKTMIRRRYAQLAAADSFHGDARKKALAAGMPAAWFDKLPPRAAGTFSGCGWPAGRLPERHIHTVVDLGCGGGLETRFMAERLPSDARIVAVDLTPEQLIRTRQTVAGISGAAVHTLAADMERLPLAGAITDAVVANAAFNLATDKAAAFAEAARILRPGGWLIAADLVRTAPLPAEILADPMAMAASLGGVIEEPALRALMQAAGFREIEISGHRPFGPVHAVDIIARSAAA